MDDKQDSQVVEGVGTDPATQDRIHWHEAFYEALQYELGNYKDYLSFENERLLSKEALKMDVLIIKKDKGIKVEKNIGRIFKSHNIFEYKSETDYLSIYDYYKVLGYALLYASFEKVKKSEVTVSFVVSRHPRDLLKYLKDELKLKVEKIEEGIHYVTDDIITIQVLEQKKLSSKTNLFLKVLRSDTDLDDVVNILNLWNQEDMSMKSKFLETVIVANEDKFKEAIEVSATLQRIYREVAVEHGWDKERDELTRIEIARTMIADGESNDKIVRYTRLTLSEIEKLRANI